jgi:tetratricopeptide (TPR) repeat protein
VKRALVLALALCAAGCDDDDAPAHLRKARDATQAGRADDALREYRLAIEALERDTSREAAVYRARALRGAADVYYLELHDAKRAVSVYRELIRQCPEAPETLGGRLHLADLLEREYRDRRATIAELTEALARNPPQAAELAYRVSRLYFDLGEYQQSELEAAQVARKYETSAMVDDALFLRGQALAMMDGKKRDAQRAFLDLIDRFPDSELQPHALFELGRLQADAGESEKAIETWISALKRHPQPEAARAFIARVPSRLRATTPDKIGDSVTAFDRHLVPVVVAMPKTSAEAVGGTKAEAEREAKMKAEPVQRPPPAEHAAPPAAEAAPEAAPAAEAAPAP